MKRTFGLALLFCATAQAQDHPLTLDTHVDIPLSYMHDATFDAGKDGPLKVDLPKMRRGGLDAAFFVVYVEQGPLTPAGYAKAVAQAARKYDAIDLMLKRYPDQIRLARTPDDVRANKAAGRLSAMVAIENSYSLGHDLKRLDAAYARGARYVGLAHVGNNDLCGSSLPSKDLGDKPDSNLGLSDFGRQVVRRANALGMMVDISHASDACVRDVLALSTAPIIASHSSARAITDHPRNLPDELLKAIADKGGVIQAVAYKEFLKKDPAREAAEKALQARVAREAGDKAYDSEKHDYLPAYTEGMRAIQREHPLATLDDFLDHIQHMVKVAGIDHVGIASDFDGGGEITGWMDASETRNVTAGLKRRGFSDADIAKIWSGNLLRVWSADEAASSASLDKLVDEAVARYDIPGIAVGVIQDGNVVYTRTAGVRVAGSRARVDSRTLFKIASNSKAMTTALIARLVAAGKLHWDDPVVKYLPDFRMNDPWVTREIQVRDLLIHNSGLREGAGDLMLWPEPNHFTRKDILAGLAYLKPEHSFRSRYAYDNLLYVVAGEVAAAAGGASYETLLRREVLEPLGLSRCQIGSWSRDGVGNVAQPHRHGEHGNDVVGADPATIPAITSAAAGGVRCDLDDMLRWAGNWLAPDASQLAWLDAKQREPLWSIQNPMPVGQRRKTWNDTHLYGYGYGWRLADVDGQWSVSHTGTLSGMYSTVSLLPEQRSGFVIMMNGGGEDARDTLAEALLKRLTVPGETHTVGEYADRIAAEASAPGASRAPDTSSRVTASTDDAKAFLGVWRDPWFGEVSICPVKGGVGFVASRSPAMTGTLRRVGTRYLVQWKGERMDAEPWLDLSAPDRLRLTKVDPDADFSNDYEDLDFARVRACP
jgi:microsomal dipeptidase-like Zn-dependent dipeptidase/CubicO group peptidase (beta-lactamase class C family)